MAYANFSFQYDSSEPTPEPLQLLRSCIITLTSIRNVLKLGKRIDQFPPQELNSMLIDLGVIWEEIYKLISTKEMQLYVPLLNQLTVILPEAASALNTAIPFREEYDVYGSSKSDQGTASAKLNECIIYCQKCSAVLSSILSHPDYLPVLRVLRLDK